MNLYKRWEMRASRESKHQAETRAERIVFGIMDHMLAARLISLKDVNEDIINDCMETLLKIATEYVSVKKSGIKPIEMAVFPVMTAFMAKDHPLFRGGEWIIKQEKLEDISFLESLAEHIRRCDRD